MKIREAEGNVMPEARGESDLKMRFEDATLLASKMGRRPLVKERGSRSWNRPGNRFYYRDFIERAAPPTCHMLASD